MQIGQYTQGTMASWPTANDREVLFGPRALMGETAAGRLPPGSSLEEARIYGEALDCSQVGRLVPSSLVAADLVGQWRFDGVGAVPESTGNWGALTLRPGARVDGGLLRPADTWVSATDYIGPPISAKSLVAWVSLSNLDVRGGSPLGLSDGSSLAFDAIVYAESDPRRWMAGSNALLRTVAVPQPDETVQGAVIQVGVSYAADGRVRLCRNGRELGTYVTTVAPIYKAGTAVATFGARGLVGNGDGWGRLAGAIDEARIYRRAMDCTEMGNLSRAAPDGTMLAGPQVPVDGLVAYLPGVPESRADPAVSLYGSTGFPTLRETGQGQGGRYFRFSGDDKVVGIRLPRPLLPRTVPAALLADGRGSGATLAFWYRSVGAAQKENPLISLPAPAGSWPGIPPALGLLDGVPAFFTLSATLGHVPGAQFSSAPRVDDGAWHHLAFVFERGDPSCASAQCSTEGRAVVRLFVDDEAWGTARLRDFTLSSAAPDNAVQFGAFLILGNTVGRTYGDFDDLRVYERAITNAEVVELSGLRGQGVRSSFPPVNPAKYPALGALPAVDGTGLVGSQVAIAVPNDFDLASHPLSGTVPLNVPVSTTLQDDLSGIGPYTAQAWLGSGPDTTLQLRVPLPNWYRVDISVSSTVTLRCYDGNNNKVGESTSLAPPFAGGEPWVLLTMTWSATTFSAGLGGHIPASIGCGFNGSPTIPRVLARGMTVEGVPGPLRVLQFRLFDRVLTPDRQQEVGGYGPVVWAIPSEPASALVAFVPRPVIVRRGPLLYDGQPTTPVFPTVFRPWASPAGAVVRPGGSALDAQIETDPATNDGFTVSMLVEIAQGNGWVALAGRELPSGAFDVRLALDCKVADGGCYPYLTVPHGGPGSPLKTWIQYKPIPFGRPVRITFTSTTRNSVPTPSGPSVVTAPKASYDGVAANVGAASYPLVDISHLSYLGVTRPTYNSAPEWYFGRRSWSAANDLTFSDVRIYSHAIGDVAAIGGACTGQTCQDSGQLCLSSGPRYSAQCGGCLDSAYSFSAGPSEGQLDCRVRAPGGRECSFNGECAAGTCLHGGVCASTTAAECATVCGKQSRACGGTSPFGCGGCLPGFSPFGQDLSRHDTVCLWDPTRDSFEPCDTDAQCYSGKCATTTTSRYDAHHRGYWVHREWSDTYWYGCCVSKTKTCGRDFWYANPVDLTNTANYRQCAATTSQECSQEGRQFTTEAVTLPDGRQSTVYSCARVPCGAGSSPKFRVLSAEACRAAWDRADDSFEVGQCLQHFSSSTDTKAQLFTFPKRDQFFNLTDRNTSTQDLLLVMKQMFLGDLTAGIANQAALLTQLENAGVGTLLLQYVTSTAAQRLAMETTYGRFLPLGGCAGDLANPTTGPWDSRAVYRDYFGNSPLNVQVCTPNRTPNGTPCPPPGAISRPGFTSHDYCESRYCARKTDTCEEGTNPVGQPNPDGGNQHNAGQQSTKFGIIKGDNASLDIKEESTVGTSDEDFEYDGTFRSTYNLCLFGANIPPLPLFEVDIHTEARNAFIGSERCTTNELGLKFIGINLVPAPPAPLLGSCSLLRVTNAQVCSPPSCTGPSPESLISPTGPIMSALFSPPSLSTCLPIPEEEFFSRSFLIGPVPCTVSVSGELGICIGASVGLSSAGMPQLEIKPSFDVEASAKAGVGVDFDIIKAFLGAKLTILVIGISLPIVFGTELTFELFTEPDPGGTVPLAQAILNFKFGETISLVLEFLSGSFSLVAEFEFFGYTFERELELFAWEGLTFEYTLQEAELFRTRLDFDFVQGGGVPPGNTTSCNGQCGN